MLNYADARTWNKSKDMWDGYMKQKTVLMIEMESVPQHTPEKGRNKKAKITGSSLVRIKRQRSPSVPQCSQYPTHLSARHDSRWT